MFVLRKDLFYEQLIKNTVYASGFMNHSVDSTHVCVYTFTFFLPHFTATTLPFCVPSHPSARHPSTEGLHASSQVYFHSSRGGIPPLSRDWLCYIKMVKLRFEGRRAFHWRSYYTSKTTKERRRDIKNVKLLDIRMSRVWLTRQIFPLFTRIARLYRCSLSKDKKLL